MARTSDGWPKFMENPANLVGSDARVKPEYQRWKSPASWPLRTRVRICSSRWAARGIQRICCFSTMRLLITWLTADSVNAMEPPRFVPLPYGLAGAGSADGLTGP
jgi:hypothetical protein